MPKGIRSVNPALARLAPDRFLTGCILSYYLEGVLAFEQYRIDGYRASNTMTHPQPKTPWPAYRNITLLWLLLSLSALTLSQRPLEEISNQVWVVYSLGSLLYFYLFVAQIRREQACEKRRQLSNEQLQLLTKNRIEMLKAISHDIRTPLTRLQLRTIQLKGVSREKSRSDLKEIEQKIEASLNFLRNEESQELPEPTNINRLIRTLQEEMAQSNHHFSIDGQCHTTCFCQPQQVRTAIKQLLDNAFQYGTEVELHLSDEKNSLRVEILDNGPGIEKNLLEEAKQPYFRADSSRGSKTGGAGLGLSTANMICKMHNGSLTLTNRLENGLRATVRLPCKPGNPL